LLAITIHAEDGIEWHRKRMPFFVAGLHKIKINARFTNQRTRQDEGPAILFGTSLWREIESAPGDWMLVDRASYGNPEYVQLAWNGHGRRGDHCVPEHHDGSRWEADPQPLLPMREPGECRVICGQTETYSPHWPSIEAWYARMAAGGATHFRPHPAGATWGRLPTKRDFNDSTAIVLNSSIGVQCVFDGIDTEVHDEGAMSYGLWERYGNDRQAWAAWLAWTQWRWDEIRDGEPIRHLFDRAFA
jgi:hypothetical protein